MKYYTVGLTKKSFKTFKGVLKEQGRVKVINLCEGDTIELFTGFACITKIEKKDVKNLY